MQQNETLHGTDQVKTFDEFTQHVDYSLMHSLTADPDKTDDGFDHLPREVCSGHFVPVKPKPISAPLLVTHSKNLFQDLGLDDALAQDEEFSRLFSGDIGVAKEPMKPYGWATGYALSICRTEYTEQCPFRTGNGYGDGRAISVFEGVFRDQRWEMQLKGSGPTPYCRGADGRCTSLECARVSRPRVNAGSGRPFDSLTHIVHVEVRDRSSPMVLSSIPIL